MEEIIVLLIFFLFFLCFLVCEIVKRVNSRLQRRKQKLFEKGWFQKPLFVYPDGTMVLIPSRHFHGHEGSRVIFVSKTWKKMPRRKWFFDKIWDEEDHPIKKVRKDGKFALVDKDGNVISNFYPEVKINLEGIKVQKDRDFFPIAVMIDPDGKITLQKI